jgi:PKD repeat protein
VNGIPHAQFGGTNDVVGGGGNMLPSYTTEYNSLINYDSPLEVSLSFGQNSLGKYVIVANVTLTGDISTTNNKLEWVLTQHYSDEYFCVARRHVEQDFTLNATGETGVYGIAFDPDEDWDMADFQAVLFVQSMDSHQILQAAMTGESETAAAYFESDVQSGPGDLNVQFNDSSFPGYLVDSWAWDFDGDGTTDSTDPNPSWTYTTVGSYDVSLTIHTSLDETLTFVRPGYITVNPNTDITGNISGNWRPEYGTYCITGDAVVPVGTVLTLQPGTDLQIAHGKSLRIDGQIQALGTAENPIRFHGVDGATWTGFIAQNNTIASNFNYCDIRDAGTTAFQVMNSTLNIRNSKLHHNTSSGAPVCDLSSNANILIEGCLIANNTSTGGSGAIQITSSTPTLRNNIFANNEGVTSGAILIRTNSNPQLINNTIANNHSSGTNNTCIYAYNTSATLMNNIIIGTGANQVYPFNATLTAMYNNVSSGLAGDHNIQVDPMFISPSAGDGSGFDGLAADWRLQSGSPCIDAGNPDVAYNDTEDPNQAGSPLYPALGTLTNDMGATGGAGFELMVATDDPGSVPVPAGFAITVAPNPFNPSTAIAFSLVQPTQTTVTIFNLKGEVVRTLVKGTLPAGDHSVVWNGTDDNGRSLASGVYFSMVRSGSQTSVAKMVMLK